MTQILPFTAYQHVFAKWQWKKAKVIGDKGNFGDSLLRHATNQLFVYFNITSVESIQEADVVFWGAGGNMGPLYYITASSRKHIQRECQQLGKPFIILPQSWNGPEDLDVTESFAREVYSMKFEPSAKLAPDLSLCFIPEIEITRPTNDVGRFFRADYEKVEGLVGIDPNTCVNSEDEYLQLAWSYKTIHTNRLHFAIAGLLADREVFLYPNSYHKNRGVFELWLRGWGCKWRDNVSVLRT